MLVLESFAALVFTMVYVMYLYVQPKVVKLYNSYYQTHTILGNKNINSFRVYLSEKVAIQIEKSMGLLGISVPNRM